MYIRVKHLYLLIHSTSTYTFFSRKAREPRGVIGDWWIMINWNKSTDKGVLSVSWPVPWLSKFDFNPWTLGHDGTPKRLTILHSLHHGWSCNPRLQPHANPPFVAYCGRCSLSGESYLWQVEKGHFPSSAMFSLLVSLWPLTSQSNGRSTAHIWTEHLVGSAPWPWNPGAPTRCST